MWDVLVLRVFTHIYSSIQYQYGYGGWKDKHGFKTACIVSYLMLQCDSNYPSGSKNVRFQVLTVVMVRVQTFWHVTPCH
jgi:hypothetical protein